MQLDAQDFLRLVESNKSLGFVDIESTGFRGDYNSVLVVSVLPFHGLPESFAVKQPGNDEKVVKDAKRAMEKLDAWVTYYGKGFDIPMLNTRLLKWGLTPINPRPHIDMYYSLKYALLTSRHSQSHLLSWLQTPEQKMGVSADVWASISRNPKKYMPEMIERCESDCKGLQDLYDKTKHLIKDIKR